MLILKSIYTGPFSGSGWILGKERRVEVRFMGVFLQGCRSGLLFSDEPGISASESRLLAQRSSPPPPADVTLSIWGGGIQGLHPPPADPSVLTVPALGVAFRGSGLDLRGGGQCPGLGVRRSGVWNWLFL